MLNLIGNLHGNIQQVCLYKCAVNVCLCVDVSVTAMYV